MKFVLFQNSNTQRVTVNLQDSDDTLISKEYRTSPNEDWKTGKGITIPSDKLIFLGNILQAKTYEELSKMLDKYEIL